MPWHSFQFDRLGGRPNIAGLYRQVTGRSAWPASLAVMAVGVVVVLPLLLLLLVGLAVGLSVYVVASAVDRLFGGAGRTLGRTPQANPPTSMRENVRVIGRPGGTEPF